jgi:hypothetical protein
MNKDLAKLFFLFMLHAEASKSVIVLIYKMFYISETIEFSIYLVNFLLNMIYV